MPNQEWRVAEEVEHPQTARHGLALVAGQRKLCQPASSHGAEQISRWPGALEVTIQGGVDLVLEAHALAYKLSPAREAPAQGARGLVGQPAALQQAGPQQLGQGTGIAAVGLGLGV